MDRKKIEKTTRLPVEVIPLIIVHWWARYYYGSHEDVLELRKFLEPKLRDRLHSQDAVRAWIKNAEGWKIITDHFQPGYVDGLLEEYHAIHLVC